MIEEMSAKRKKAKTVEELPALGMSAGELAERIMGW